ncbi:PAS domain S-box protein [Acidithrix sp. C25]|uniref:PAS domain S-box protein n=1 Tax=Acidithrix sp. C25 TaxID=1671482 RepID=UPI00191BABEB|nr:PAS domain S-box protein [Acidithrix sp. C25]
MIDFENLEPRGHKLTNAPREIIAGAIDSFVDFFFSSYSKFSHVADIFSLLTPEETENLRHQFVKLLIDLLDPQKTVEDLLGLFGGLGQAHATIGVRPAWTIALNHQLIEMLSTHLLGGGIARPLVDEYCFGVSMRLDMLIKSVFDSETAIEEELDLLFDRVSEMVAQASTSADLIRNFLGLLHGLDGVDMVAFGRPDGNGVVQYEYYVGDKFSKYQRQMELGNVSPISVRSSAASGMGPSGRSFRSGRVEVCNSIAMDPGMAPWREDLISLGLRSGVGLPVTAGNGDVVAVINGYSRVLGYFGMNRRRRILEHVCHLFSDALSRLDSSDLIISHGERKLFRSLLYGGGLEIVYQPIVNLRSGDLYKVEALARLRDSNGELLSPARFLRAFGSDDLFYLFEQGLNTGLSAILAWRRHGLSCGLSVNFPPQGMFDDRYIKSIERNLSESGVDPYLLTLELTEDEDLLLGDGLSSTVLHRARAMGVHLAQDDLGAGYSSLLRLESVGFDEVKIDQELIRSPTDVAHSVDLVAHLTDLAHDLGMRVVVEGLENDSLVEAVAILGADFGQGYGLGHPVSFEGIVEWSNRFRYDEPAASVRTSLGALAYLRKWSRRVIALETFLKSIDVSDLVSDLKLRIGGLNSDLIDRRILEFVEDSRQNAGLGSLLRLEEDLARLINLNLEISRSMPAPTAHEGSAFELSTLNSISLRQMKDLHSLQGRLLAEIEEGISPSQVVEDALIEIEKLIPGSMASVLILDDDANLNVAWSPSLPPLKWPLLSGLSISNFNGLDGLAILQNKEIFVSNVRSDPGWSDLREAVEILGISACWSVPLRENSADTIGVLSIFIFNEGIVREFDSMLLQMVGSIISLCLKLKKADEIGASRQEFLSTLFELPTAYKFSIRASDGGIVQANREAIDRFGYKEDVIRTLSVFDLIPELDRRRSLVLQFRYGVTSEWAGELVVRDHLGGSFRMHYHTALHGEGEDAELFLALVEFRDGDELVAQFRHERTLNDRIMASVAASVMVLDKRGQITRFNRGAELLTGRSSHEVLANPELWRSWIDPKDQTLIEETFLRVMKHGDSGVNEVWHHHLDGTKRLVEMHYTSVLQELGDSNAAIVIYGIDVTERSRNAALVRDDLDFIAQVIEAIPKLIFVLDRSGRVIRCNRVVLEFTGTSLEEIMREPFRIVEYFSPEAQPVVRAWFVDALAGNVSQKTISAWIRGDGERRVIEWINSAIYDLDGLASSFVIVGTDITEARIAEKQLQKAAVVFEHTSEAIVIVDADSRIIDINPACVRMTGFQREDLIGQSSRFLASESADFTFYDYMNTQLRSEGHWSGSLEQRRKDGSTFSAFVNISTIFGKRGAPELYVVLFSDISDLMDYQSRLAKLAYFDHLTNLPNRSLVGEKMADQLALNRRFGGMTALAFLDLDNFKPVNDRYGHRTGDELLITLARRIESAIREVDTVARIGGDEFVCILGSIDEIEVASEIIGRIMQAIGAPVAINEECTQWVTITASIGVSFSKTGNDDPDALLRRADHLMYEAKRRGGNCYVFEGE